jgi:hypothetical protein
MPRRLKDKRRRGVLIINGVELAVLNTQPGGGDGGGDPVGVIAQYPLSKARPRGAREGGNGGAGRSC